jgi:septum site-determining protein MinC
MVKNGIIIKGNMDGLVAVINMNMFKDFEDMLNELKEKLNKGKKFYKGCNLTITTQLKFISERDMRKLKDILFYEFMIKDCIFEDSEETSNKFFTGIYEGRTKFIRKTIRSGQIIQYTGNVVILGDVNPGAEIYAAGNIIVLGTLKGCAHAGRDGNKRAIIAAYNMQAQLIQIANIMTRAPEDDIKPAYPEVAKIKNENIIVEPYLPNKYI